MDLPAVLIPGARLHGFTVESAAAYPLLNLSVYTLKHDASGAQYVHIARPDADNAFCLAFRTLPVDDTGVAHILEHTVLCGSEQYPVRDPFFLLLNRSLNTFMNAMTRPEVTFYPFSTQNERDFTNLLSVYLDACFFPHLDAFDFKQEGHRVEFIAAAAAAAVAVPAAEAGAAVAAAAESAATPKDAVEAVTHDDIAVALEALLLERGVTDIAALSAAEYGALRARAEAQLAADAKDGGIYSGSEADTDGEIDPAVMAEDQKVYGGTLSRAAEEAIERAEAQQAQGSFEPVTVRSRMRQGTDADDHTNAGAADAAAAETAAAAASAPSAAPVYAPASPSAAGGLEFKGVVLNEMKGALSDPSQLFDAELSRHLFPTSLYRHNSGGDPAAIPNLTHAQLRAFHRSFYHPANACFFTYGDLNPRLAEVDAVLNKKMQQLAAAGAPVAPPTTTTSSAAAAAADVDENAPGVPIVELLAAGRPPALADARAALRESQRFAAPRAVATVGPDSALTADPDKQSKFMLSWLCRRETITDLSRPSLLAAGVDVAALHRSHAHVAVGETAVPEAEIEDQLPAEGVPASVTAWEQEAAARAADRIRAAGESAAGGPAAAAAADAGGAVVVSSDSAPAVALVPTFAPGAAAHAPAACASAPAAAVAAALAADNPLLEVLSFQERARAGFERRAAELAALPPADVARLNESMEAIGLSLLSSLLLESPSSPLYDVLTDPARGAGPAPGTGAELSTYERPFSVGLHGCHPDSVDESAATILRTLEDIAASGVGLERESVHALLHLVEMGIKEPSRHYGVGLLQRLVPGFVFGDDVQTSFAVLGYLDSLRRSADEFGSLYFRALLRHHLVSNPHRLLTVMHADAGYTARLRAAEQSRLAAQQAALTPAAADQIEADARELRARQEVSPDPSCLPTLTVADINPSAVTYSVTDVRAGGAAAATSLAPQLRSVGATADSAALAAGLSRSVSLSQQPTNGVVYLRTVLDAPLASLTPQQLQLLPLLSAVLPELGVAGRGRRAHAQLLERYSGGVRLSHTLDVPDETLGQAELRVIASTKALLANADKAAYLLVQTVTRPDFSDHLYNALTQYSGSLASAMQDSAVRYARHDASSRLEGMPAALLGHFLSGLPHAQAVTALVTAINNETKAIAGAAALAEAKANGDTPTDSEGALVTAVATDALALPPGLTVSPTLAKLANDLAGLVRALFLGPRDTRVNAATGAVERAPTTAELEERFGGELDCAPLVSAPSTHPRGGLSRALVTADAASLGSPLTRAAADILVDGSYWVQPVAYSPLLSLVARAGEDGPADAAAAPGGFVSAEQWLDSLVQGNASGAYVRQGRTAAEVMGGGTGAGVPSLHRNPNGLKRRNYIALPVQVHTNVMCLKTVPFAHPDSAPLTVLAEVLSARYLHREIREKGGAYGGFASHDRTGVFTFGSYRDPRALGTVHTFESAALWAQDSNNYGERFLDEAKLSLFSAIDAPETPGAAGLYPWLRGASQEQRQLYRDRLLGATRADLERVARTYLHTHTAQVTVVGPRDNIPAEIDESALADGAWSITVVDAAGLDADAAAADAASEDGTESEGSE
jgi:Zn-dependent M16 (insulinase) family peptidase